MNYEKAKQIMKIERECVLRQDTPKCQRDECGCQGCDLIQDAIEVLSAYDYVIQMLDMYEYYLQQKMKDYDNVSRDPRQGREVR